MTVSTWNQIRLFMSILQCFSHDFLAQFLSLPHTMATKNFRQTFFAFCELEEKKLSIF